MNKMRGILQKIMSLTGGRGLLGRLQDDVSSLILTMGIASALAVTGIAVYKEFANPKPLVDVSSLELSKALEEKEFYDGMKAPALSALKGVWAMSNGGGRAYLVVLSNRFRLFYWRAGEQLYQRYSAGLYEYDNRSGRLNLRPDRKDEAPEQRGVTYSILTRRDFAFRAGRGPDLDTMILMPDAPSHRDDMMHPIHFLEPGDRVDRLVWKRQVQKKAN